MAEAVFWVVVVGVASVMSVAEIDGDDEFPASASAPADADAEWERSMTGIADHLVFASSWPLLLILGIVAVGWFIWRGSCPLFKGKEEGLMAKIHHDYK